MEHEYLHRVLERIEGELALIRGGQENLERLLARFQGSVGERGAQTINELLSQLGGTEAVAETLSSPKVKDVLLKALGGEGTDLASLLAGLSGAHGEDPRLLDALLSLNPETNRSVHKLKALFPLVSATQKKRRDEDIEEAEDVTVALGPRGRGRSRPPRPMPRPVPRCRRPVEIEPAYQEYEEWSSWSW